VRERERERERDEMVSVLLAGETGREHDGDGHSGEVSGRSRKRAQRVLTNVAELGGNKKCSTGAGAGGAPPGSVCGVTSDCENRHMRIECLNSVDHKDCQNQRLQKKQFARVEVFKTGDGRGWGLKALEDISSGDLVQEYIGEVVTTAMCKARLRQYGPDTPVYFLAINRKMVIDASSKGSVARFINHSCDPNCETEKWEVGSETRIAIVAKKDIVKGTELTYNYNFESFGGHQVKCLCGSHNCIGFLGK
jgi:SET domain-containing protein